MEKKKLHSNQILLDNLNKRDFQTLFAEFNDLFNICKGLININNTSLYLRVYNLLIYALFDLIHYSGFNYICAVYGEDFADNERFYFLPKYGIIFDHIMGKYLTFEEWKTFCRDFVEKSQIYTYNITDFSLVDLSVCIDAFFEIPLPDKDIF